MQSMVDRWKDKLNSIEQKPISTANLSNIPPHPPSKASETNAQQQSHITMKKSIDKSKRSLHSHEDKVLSSKRLHTPSKKKMSKNAKSQAIEKAYEEIFEIFAKATAADKTIKNKIKGVLEQVWSKCSEALEMISPRNLIPTSTELDVSIMKQSTVSTGTAKKQQKLYQDLQKKYFECQKQRQFLKNKIDSLLIKYENVDKQLQKYGKMQKLIDKCIQRQQQTREQNKRLKNQLQLKELKLLEQQKVFQEEVNVVRKLVEEIKKNLPTL